MLLYTLQYIVSASDVKLTKLQIYCYILQYIVSASDNLNVKLTKLQIQIGG